MLKIKLNLRKFLYIFYEYFKVLFKSVRFWVKFANAKSMISDMAQNNPAALQALQKEYGAGGTTSGEKFGVSDFKGANVLLQANLNHEQVGIRLNNAKKITNLPDGIDLKGKQSIDAKKVSQNYKNSSLTQFI